VIVSSVPGETVTANRTSPLDQPETYRFSQKEIKDVYAATDIDPSARMATKAGRATLIELRGAWAETDSVDVTYRKLIPYKVGIQFTMPTNASVTADMALAAILRAYGLVFETGTVTSAGINNILHGALRKADL